MSVPLMFYLVPNVMHYHWGHKGLDSFIAQLLSNQYGDKSLIQHDQPYAELWMGTHKTAPSLVAESSFHHLRSTTLIDLIEKNKETLLGSIMAAHQGTQGLPFLMKVLSVCKPLSIQAHPTKQLAEQLHRDQPSLYKDNNHKPEMVIALTKFSALVGFQALAELQTNLETYPEYAELIGPKLCTEILNMTSQQPKEYPSTLKKLFHNVMLADQTIVSTKLNQLINRIAQKKIKSPVDMYIESIHKEFPGDVGVFALLFMNMIHLEPGQSLFLGANELHAYVSGDCIEIMASSDNVVRAGLTPKFRDTQTLINMLAYSTNNSHRVTPTPLPKYPQTIMYKPPITEFQIQLTKSVAEAKIPISQGPSIAIITNGTGNLRASLGAKSLDLAVKPGSVVYIIPNAELVLIPDVGSQITMFQASAQDEYFH